MKNLTIISGQESRLLHYDAACRALAEAHRIDEVTHIHDMAAAAQEYARQAQNYDLEKQAFAIRKRAERKAGQMLKEMPKNKGGPKRVKNNDIVGDDTTLPKLPELGITYDQSSMNAYYETVRKTNPDFVSIIEQEEAEALGESYARAN